MSKLAIIPARGGSKRIPRKNIKIFIDKPIIAYSIQSAIDSCMFDEIMVSTDDEEIANVALKYGAKVPFLRSAKNADDFATTFDVVSEVLNNYTNNSIYFEYTCCIYPAAPLILSDNLKHAFQILIDNKFDTVFPVAPYTNNIYRALKADSDYKVSFIWPENINKRSQDLPEAYYDAAQFYWFKSQIILEKGKIITDNTGVIKLHPGQVQDIDNEHDWLLAELKFKQLNGK
jgi:N-acylneuraminate cytidylyltransferase